MAVNILYSEEDISKEQWQQLCIAAKASWFQTHAAYMFYRSLPAEMEPFCMAIERDNVLKGVVVGYITKSGCSLKQYFMRRAIIHGGPLLSDDMTADELQALLHALIQMVGKQSIYIETRNYIDYQVWKPVFETMGWHYLPHYDIHIDVSQYEDMYKRVAKPKQRQIRQYQNQNIELITQPTDHEIQVFYGLLSRLYRHKIHLPLFSLGFFKQFVYQQCGTLLLLKQDKEIVGGMLCPVCKDSRTIYEWYVVGPTIVTWKAMEYAHEQGLHTFDMMGAGVPGNPYGVRDFKLAMGGELKEYGRYVYISRPILYAIGKAGIFLKQLFG